MNLLLAACTIPGSMVEPSLKAVVVPLFGGALEARSDDELMVLARGGRPAAFDVLVRRHQASALKVAARYLGSPADARDACQNAFLEVYRSLTRYQPQGSFVFYLRRVLLNQCRMLGRSAATRIRIAGVSSVDVPVAARLPDEALLAKERARALTSAVCELSDKLREVVALKYAGEHSLEETAAILELPVGTVKSRLFSAMDKLKGNVEAFR